MNSINQNPISPQENNILTREEEVLNEEIDLSLLSYSSYDSLQNLKFEKMNQLTCDECSEIPKIITTNQTKKTILFKCKKHGQKEINVRNYIVNSLKYNPINWKCCDSEHFQKDTKEVFKYCECGLVYCPQCFNYHQKSKGHSHSIDGNKYFLYCKKPGHFEEKFIAYCNDCNENFCKLCENAHKNHSKVYIDTMEVEQKEIEKIKDLNKEYRRLITYYESLIRLNNLIIHAYENNRDNYYNLYNINRIINNIKRDSVITPLNETDNFNKAIVSGESNSNFEQYINNLYNQKLNTDETIEIKINNKFFNNFDLNILTKIPLFNLKILELENNGITKIDCLENAEFPELIILSLRNNAIDDISILEKVKFQEIQGILLNNNNISDISVLKKIKFKKLRLIDLRNNKIENIEVFGELGKEILDQLQCIYLSGNKFDINSFDSIKKILEKCNEHLF